MVPTDHCYVAETAVVIGKVRIKVGASIWFGSILRGDNEWIEVGERTNIQDNCTLHTDPFLLRSVQDPPWATKPFFTDARLERTP